MNWNRYAMHLEVSHDLYMMEDNSVYLELEEVIYCWGIWIQDLSENPPSPDPRYYDSEKGFAISDFNSQSEESSDDDEPPKLLPLPQRRNSSTTEILSESEPS